MTSEQDVPPTDLTIAVIGGGFSGSVFALKALAALPEARIILIEQRHVVGRGLAYGACAPFHLLNVPVSRAEVGLKPSFRDWLGHHDADMSVAVEESEGDLSGAFVERELYGAYLESQLQIVSRGPSRLAVLFAQAVRVETGSGRQVVLDDGRMVNADIVVLATGNLPARPLSIPGLTSDAMIINDPWRADAL